MARAQIVEVDFHQFMRHLRAANESGGCIDPSDRDRWKAYVREHDVKEASCRSYAKPRSEKVKAAIIDNGGPWDGYYVYAAEEEFALKFVPGDAGAPGPG